MGDSSKSTVRIELNAAGIGTAKIDDLDVSNSVTRVTLDAKPGLGTGLTLGRWLTRRRRCPVADYLDGPNGHHRYETYLDCYRGDPSIEAPEAAAELAAAIDYWLCGPADDGDEGQEYILTRTVERAARFIAAHPCLCTEDLCDRCMAIGCGYGEHRTPACREVSGA